MPFGFVSSTRGTVRQFWRYLSLPLVPQRRVCHRPRNLLSPVPRLSLFSVLPQQVGEFGSAILSLSNCPGTNVSCARSHSLSGMAAPVRARYSASNASLMNDWIVFPFVNGSPPANAVASAPRSNFPSGNNPWMRERAFSAPVTAVSNLNPCSG